MTRAARSLAAALAICCAPLLAGAPARAAAPCTDPVTAASYDTPTNRYAHGALGDPWEWGSLRVTRGACPPLQADLPRRLVFEDTRPRLQDLDHDGVPEILVVESHRDLGARLAIWAVRGDDLLRIAATPFIGRSHRWLAPLGAADLDGDGKVEIAYIDRPHLARTLRIWRFDRDGLTQIAAAEGYTNHRFGQTEISGGIRDCGQGPEIVAANANWTALMALRLEGGQIAARALGSDTSAEGFAAALACR